MLILSHVRRHLIQNMNNIVCQMFPQFRLVKLSSKQFHHAEEGKVTQRDV